MDAASLRGPSKTAASLALPRRETRPADRLTGLRRRAGIPEPMPDIPGRASPQLFQEEALGPVEDVSTV